MSRTSVWRTGFNPVNGCGFDSKGNFYAVEFQANGFNPGPTGNPAGDIVKISPHGNRTVIGAGKPNQWKLQVQYGSNKHEVAEAVIQEWLRQGAPTPEPWTGLWFGLPWSYLPDERR